MEKWTHDRRLSSASDRRRSYQPIQLNDNVRFTAGNASLPSTDNDRFSEIEHTISRREIAILAREEAMAERENDLKRREELLILNQGKATAIRIQEISDAQLAHTLQEFRQSKLIEANEKLKLALIQHHILPDEIEISTQPSCHLANHDFLTDLPNRLQLYDRVNHGLAFAKRHHQKMAILFLDLDDFKSINDRFGNAVGDLLLQAVVERLNCAIRNSDSVSRLAGDEFVLVLTEVNFKSTLARNVKKIHTIVTEPYVIAGSELVIGATIGISMFPEDGKDTETLIRHADNAMQFAKENGRNKYQFFSEEIRNHSLN